MKKVLPLIIIGMFVISGIGAVGNGLTQENLEKEKITKSTVERATHTVLGEFGTATWCGFCKYSHGALKELYNEGQLDFNYITYVCDKNSVASSYVSSHYNLYGYPTLWWDGGYKVNVGAGSVPAAKSTYTSSINQCGAKTVKDVDIDLGVTWIPNTEMQIDCTVNNNEGSTYDGTIQVAIVEKVSSRGWRDTGGQLYTMAFLAWAFKEPISISSGGSWSDSINWDGTSNGFPTITEENILIIAAVYNDEPHQGYSYPPSSNPFTAYYIDDCIAAEPGQGSTNKPPEKPEISGPNTGVQDKSYDFQFTSTDPDENDIRFYIMWDDGKIEYSDYIASGDTITVSHTWKKTGTFQIHVKTEDSEGAESSFSTHEIIIPKSKQANYFMQIILQRFFNSFPILREILNSF